MPERACFHRARFHEGSVEAMPAVHCHGQVCVLFIVAFVFFQLDRGRRKGKPEASSFARGDMRSANGAKHIQPPAGWNEIWTNVHQIGPKRSKTAALVTV